MKKQQIVIFFIFFQILLGCSNFSPLYGKRAGEDGLDYILIKKFECSNCNHKIEYEAFEDLKKVLSYNENSPKIHYLNVTINKKSVPLAIKSNSVATRVKIFVELKYEVKSKINNEIIVQNNLNNIETMPVLRSAFSNFLAEEELTSDMIKSLLDTLRLELLEAIPKNNLERR